MFADLSPLLLVHFVSACTAIICGATIFLSRKGSVGHRWMGMTYIGAMLITIVSVIPVPATVMPIMETRFGFFHVFIVVGFVSLSIGIERLLRWRQTRDPAALKSHQVNLAYSYAGLLMAGFSQIATNPRWLLVELTTQTQFWVIFAAVNAAIYGVAAYLIQTRIAKGDPLRWKPA